MQAFSADFVFTADSAGAIFFEEGAVVVDDAGMIAAVGKAAEVIPASCPVTQVPGVLLPGLIDLHTHLCLSASADPGRDTQREHPARVAIRAADNLRLQLAAGVTTIRDVGGVFGVDLELARMVEEGLLTGPDVFAAGHVLCMTGGHACFMGIECDSPDEMRKAARSQIKAGAKVIKLIATGGVITPGVKPGAQQLSRAEMQAACEEAHKAARTVAAHAQGAEGIQAALEAGVDTIEHGFWLSDESVAWMKREGRTFVPTFAAIRAMVRISDQLPVFIQEKLDSIVAPQRDAFVRAHRAGVRLATGTDAGTPGNPHGSLADELQAFQELGMAPLDCLRAATAWGAEALRLPDRGTLSVGKRADLIAVPRAACDDLQEWQTPHLVVKQGRVLQMRAA